MISMAWFVVLMACSGSTAPETAMPLARVCPVCPSAGAPPPPCPQLPCPSPPQTPAPVADDWQCTDLYRADGTVSGFCFSLVRICEDARKDIADQQLGISTPCTPQRVAHCVAVTYPSEVSWQAQCARTAENCEQRRASLHELSLTSKEGELVGGCQPSLNINPLGSMRAPAAPTQHQTP